MDEPASDRARARTRPAGEERSLVEELLLAGLGAIALTAERADRLADELAERGGVERDEARRTIEHLLGRWRGDSVRLSERASEGLASFFRELGLVTRDEWDELELRVAQLEHRLRLVESDTERSPGARADSRSAGGAPVRLVEDEPAGAPRPAP